MTADDSSTVTDLPPSWPTIVDVVDRNLFPEHGCKCDSFGDEKRFGLGWHLMDPRVHGYLAIKRRNPWLELARCSSCGTYWYLATDTDEGDIYFVRLNDEQVRDIIERNTWPSRFDSFTNVWPP